MELAMIAYLMDIIPGFSTATGLVSLILFLTLLFTSLGWLADDDVEWPLLRKSTNL